MPDGNVKPLAVYDWRVNPDWPGVAFPRRPEAVPQTTWVSATGVPTGPRIDHVTPKVELRETLGGWAFTERNGWRNALIAVQAFTTPQPWCGLWGGPPGGWSAGPG